jgi:hypothetical protein
VQQAATGLERSQVEELAALTFVERAESVVLVGPSGVGCQGRANLPEKCRSKIPHLVVAVISRFALNRVMPIAYFDRLGVPRLS